MRFGREVGQAWLRLNADRLIFDSPNSGASRVRSGRPHPLSHTEMSWMQISELLTRAVECPKVNLL